MSFPNALRPLRAARMVLTVALTIAFTVAVAASGAQPAAATTCTDTGRGGSYGGGTGEVESPYLIATVTHLQALRDRVNVDERSQSGCHFLQTADLDLAGIPNWVPIGDERTGSSATRFRGGYDGGFHVISNLTITTSTTKFIGLFGLIDRSSSVPAGSTYVRDVALVGVDISRTWTDPGDLYVGALAGRIADDVAVSRVSVRGRISVDYRSDDFLYVGGIVGRTRSTSSVSDRVVFVGDIDVTFASTGANTQANVGGLVARSSDSSSVTLGYAAADVSVTTAPGNVGDVYAGVLVGTSSTNPSVFAEMYAVGSVTVDASEGSGVGYSGAVGFIGNINDTFTDIYYIDSLPGFAGGEVAGFPSASGGLFNVLGRTDAQMKGSEPATTMTGTDGRWVYANSPGSPDPAGTWFMVLAPAEGEYPYPVFFWERLATGGVATQLTVQAGDEQSATVGTAVPTPPSVIVRDASNDPVAGVSVTFAVGSGGGSITGDATVTTDASGIATVGGWTLGATAGTNTLTATSDGLAGSPITFTATGTVVAATTTGLSMVCSPTDPAVGARVTCEVSGGAPDVDVLWRVAAADEQVVEGVVRSGADGAGTFGFVVPRSALGRTVSVELVDWAQPLDIGDARAPVPGSLPAGEGREIAGLMPLAFAGVILLMIAGAQRVGLRVGLRGGPTRR